MNFISQGAGTVKRPNRNTPQPPLILKTFTKLFWAPSIAPSTKLFAGSTTSKDSPPSFTLITSRQTGLIMEAEAYVSPWKEFLYLSIEFHVYPIAIGFHSSHFFDLFKFYRVVIFTSNISWCGGRGTKEYWRYLYCWFRKHVEWMDSYNFNFSADWRLKNRFLFRASL